MNETTERPRAREGILQLLKLHGSLTASDLAEHLGVTPVAIRKHLDTLETEGIVEGTAVRQPRGRPILKFQLTPAASAIFPQGYKQLALDLIGDLIAEEGEPILERLLKTRNQRLQAAHFGNDDIVGTKDRIHELVKVRNQDGYMVTMEEHADSYVIKEHNCPIYQVAAKFPVACQCEVDFFTDVVQKPVVREESIIDGDASCTYRVEKA